MAYSIREKEFVWDESKNEVLKKTKTIIPSRKMTKRYMGVKRHEP